MLQLFGHPFSSASQKVLIALRADGTPFEFRMLSPDQSGELGRVEESLADCQFPLLLGDGEPVAEATCIIEHLHAHHPGPNRWVPDGEEGHQVRFLDCFFDLRVMQRMQESVGNALRPADGLKTSMQGKRIAAEPSTMQRASGRTHGDRMAEVGYISE